MPTSTTTQDGPVERIDTGRTNRPAKLRRPYEYVAGMAETGAFAAEMRDFEKSVRGDLRNSYTEFKLLGYGRRVTISFSAWPLGSKQWRPTDPVSWWEALRKYVQGQVTTLLGPDARLFFEPLARDRAARMRFDTYVYTAAAPAGHLRRTPSGGAD